MNFILPSTSTSFTLIPFIPRLPPSTLHRTTLTTATRLIHRNQPRWYCTSSLSSSQSQHNNRRKHIGLPKNVQVDPPPRQLTPDETPWEDYLIPILPGNSTPKNPSRYTSPIENPFTVLGIESSCDDTAVAIVRSDGKILGEACINQNQLTEQWGGVVPHVAREAHENAIQTVIQTALDQAQMTENDIDAIAATMGPGLEVCLRVGYRAGREISNRTKCDFVAVNHLEAHLLVSRLCSSGIAFPFLTLLVSGGHCQLLLVYSVAKYEVLGGTLDDALGEAFDKSARMLGLPVGNGGGPALERLALIGNPNAIPFPVPMSRKPNCNFSFAGLKTCVRLAIQKLGGEQIEHVDKANIAASFQHVAVKHLEQRLKKAFTICKEHVPHVDTLVVSGGVASNQVVRSRLSALCEGEGWKFIVPPVKLCTDNGVMVAWTGIERLRIGIADDTKHLDVRARWPLAGFGELTGSFIKEKENKMLEVKVNES